ETNPGPAAASRFHRLRRHPSRSPRRHAPGAEAAPSRKAAPAIGPPPLVLWPDRSVAARRRLSILASSRPAASATPPIGWPRRLPPVTREGSSTQEPSVARSQTIGTEA